MYTRHVLWVLLSLAHWRLAAANCDRVGHYSVCDDYIDGVSYTDCPNGIQNGCRGKDCKSIETTDLICGNNIENEFNPPRHQFMAAHDVKTYYISELNIPDGVEVTIGRVSCYGDCKVMKLTSEAKAPLVFQLNGPKFRVRSTGPGVVLKFHCNLPDRRCQKAPYMSKKKRMIDSVETAPNEYKFMARIKVYYSIYGSPNDYALCNKDGYKSDDDTRSNCANGQFMETIDCAGAIIHENWVLTKAECYKPRRRINDVAGYILMGALVIVGDHLRDTIEPEEEIRWVPKQRITTHPDYDTPSDFNNDIGLMKIMPAFNLDPDYRYPICLPPWYMMGQGLDYSEVILAGWGTGIADPQQAEPTNELRKETFYIIDNDSCYADTFAQYSQPITANMMCTTSSYAHPCHGDGGGPVFCSTADDYYYDVGIISYASTSLTTIWKVDEPNVNTRICNYLPWITGIINPDTLY